MCKCYENVILFLCGVVVCMCVFEINKMFSYKNKGCLRFEFICNWLEIESVIIVYIDWVGSWILLECEVWWLFFC